MIEALNAGDASAFDALYYRYRDRVARLAFRFTANHADAMDVLQETFAYLFRKFPGFRLTSSMTTFLYPAVRNLSLELRRNRRDAQAGVEAIIDLPLPDLVDADAQRTELSAVVSSLPPAQREVILLRFVDDLTVDEIAAALDIPPGTVKSRMHHAIRSLQENPKVRRYFL